MEHRINPYEKGHKAIKVLFGFGSYLSKSTLEQRLLDLMYFRVSQINGCAYCLDMHSKDLRVQGESEQRLYLVNTWREVSLFTQRERAAFEWAEAVTKLNGARVPDDVYAVASKEFTEEELVDLTIAVIGINSFNRVNIAFGIEAGSYEPGQHAVHVH